MYKLTLLLGGPANGKTEKAREMIRNRKSQWFTAKDIPFPAHHSFSEIHPDIEVLVFDEVPPDLLGEVIKNAYGLNEIFDSIRGQQLEIIICSQVNYKKPVMA